jgi:hypothetical protein
MNTAQLKKFAAEARTILKEGVIMRLEALGFKPDGSVDDEDKPVKGQGYILYRGEAFADDGFYERWMSLYNRVQQKGIQEVYEEAAYTWFNRLMAIRIMAKNDFISPVLEYASETTHIPVILAQAQQGQLPEMTASEREQLRAIIDDGRKTQEQFAILITAFCHGTPIINKCFGGVTDYTMMLLPQNIIAAGGFIDLLNNTSFITKEDYQSAELIGWLYQFYISEKKDDVFASFKAGKKAEAEDIPAATQIFTPNWIVKYMVQNTLGRIFLDNNPYADEIREKMKYLVEPSEPTPDEAIFRYERLEDLRLGDLACGSGHILNEFFDLMYELYIVDMASRREAIESIFKYNLIGIDLDTRAKQLAQFALLVKACQKDASFLDAAVMPQVLDMPEPIDIQVVKQLLPQFFLGGNELMLQETVECFKLLQQAHNLGSIMKFNISDRTRAAIEIRLQEWEAQEQETVPHAIKDLYHSFHIILALTQKYSALCMNPPYMRSGNMNDVLSKYVKNNFEEGKADLCSVFMLLAIDALKKCGKYGMINMQSWMFLSSFENLRSSLLEKYHIASLLQLGTRTFDELSGEVVQNAAFIIDKYGKETNSKGTYYRLTDGRDCLEKENLFFHAKESSNKYFPDLDQERFLEIPGHLIGFWVSKRNFQLFKECPSLRKIEDPCIGMMTWDNDRFLREWHEVNHRKIGFGIGNVKDSVVSGIKWFPYNKGGVGRKWYGMYHLVVNWENEGKEIYDSGMTSFRGKTNYFKRGLTYPRIGSSYFCVRESPLGFIFDINGPSCFPKKNELALMSYLNSVVARHFLQIFCPTLTYQVGDIFKVPYIQDVPNVSSINTLVNNNILICKKDWDAHETSWDFQQNELLAINEGNFIDIIKDFADFKGILIDPAAPEHSKLSWHYDMYKMKWETLFYRLKQNEEELNKQFIEIYGLQDELEEFVRTDEITILQQGEIRVISEPGDDSGYGDTIEFNKDVVIKQLVSYAIGCWMGRYRLDKPGLWIAHPDAKPEEVATYDYNGEKFEIDDDGIIPLMPSYANFPDNGYKRIVDFVRIAFGTEKLTENLNFIEDAIGMTIEKFMVKEFWKYHKKMYQNRPIYWLFSSKKGAFQCLTYMHRMTPYTVEQIRSKYLLPHIEWLKNRTAEMESRASQLTNAERKVKEQMTKDLTECLEYHDELHLVADQNIGFDLDDGVIKNYAKFGNVLAKLK